MDTDTPQETLPAVVEADQQPARSDNRVSLGALRLEVRDVVATASSIATQLAAIIERQSLYSTISGRAYVRVEGWSTLGALIGVLPREVATSEQPNGDYEAVVELIRTSDMQVLGRASAIVSADEDRWSSRPRYARRSMAITRATGKAFRLGYAWIMTLAGYEATPAEEMVEDAGPAPAPAQKPAPRRAPTAGAAESALACETPNCGAILSQGQAQYSRRHFGGHLLCPTCQRGIAKGAAATTEPAAAKESAPPPVAAEPLDACEGCGCPLPHDYIEHCRSARRPAWCDECERTAASGDVE